VDVDVCAIQQLSDKSKFEYGHDRFDFVGQVLMCRDMSVKKNESSDKRL